MGFADEASFKDVAHDLYGLRNGDYVYHDGEYHHKSNDDDVNIEYVNHTSSVKDASIKMHCTQKFRSNVLFACHKTNMSVDALLQTAIEQFLKEKGFHYNS